MEPNWQRRVNTGWKKKRWLDNFRKIAASPEFQLNRRICFKKAGGILVYRQSERPKTQKKCREKVTCEVERKLEKRQSMKSVIYKEWIKWKYWKKITYNLRYKTLIFVPHLIHSCIVCLSVLSLQRSNIFQKTGISGLNGAWYTMIVSSQVPEKNSAIDQLTPIFKSFWKWRINVKANDSVS